MRYVTKYLEYPIYEPAEGGYYYAGREVDSYERLSKRKAKKLMEEIWEECQKENGGTMEEAVEDYYLRGKSYWVRSWDNQMIRLETRYIGDGAMYVIERKLGSHTKGYEPYC